MAEKVHVAIIGAGSAGLTALRQVKDHTDSYILVDHGPLGTKCARVGCMPSKALIAVARDYHRRKVFDSEGIRGADFLDVDIPAVMRHVRSMRDRFADGMVKATKRLAGDHLVNGSAEIVAPNRLRIDNKQIEADFIIIATGAGPMVPNAWTGFGDRILTSDNIFEMEDLPRRIAVIGLGPLGLELGQSLSRLGIQVTGFDMKESMGAITDPQINAAALRIFRKEFSIHLGAAVEVQDNGPDLIIRQPNLEQSVDAAIVAIGLTRDLRGLGLEKLDIELDEHGVPPFDTETMQVANLPVFIAGDVDGCRPILHEALDDGFIAGRNSSSGKVECYCRRTSLAMVFSDPEIAVAGWSYQRLKNSGRSFVVGEVDFSRQSRAILEMRNYGFIRTYVDSQTAEFLGAELVCSGAEHLAHQLALAAQQKLNIFDVLQIPFYHPTIEEGLRTALQNAAKRLPKRHKPPALSLCGNCPEPPLC